MAYYNKFTVLYEHSNYKIKIIETNFKFVFKYFSVNECYSKHHLIGKGSLGIITCKYLVVQIQSPQINFY